MLKLGQLVTVAAPERQKVRLAGQAKRSSLMQSQILLVGRFEDAWEEQLRKLAPVVRVLFVEDALRHLEKGPFAVVLATGVVEGLAALLEKAPHTICLESEESEQSLFLRSVLDNLPHMVFVKDAKDLRFVRWNKAGERLVGISLAEMVGKTDYDFFPPEEAAFFQMKDREVLNKRVMHDIPEETINTRHGVRILHTKKIPIYNEDGEPLYLLGISEDITELKEMKAQAASRLEAAREDERRHIARELHDELGQLLTALKLDLGWLQGQLSSPLRRQTDAMSGLLDHTIKTVRRLATELRPQILDDLGLQAGLEWLAKQSCERKGLAFELRWELADSLVNDDARSALFRICQEALNNVIRHSQATRVNIELRRDPRHLTLVVQDDGVGFPPEDSLRTGLGLLGIQERIGLLGGTCVIDSEPNAGTRLVVSAPVGRCLRQN
jgi:PAS domain S-box-containing protein